VIAVWLQFGRVPLCLRALRALPRLTSLFRIIDHNNYIIFSSSVTVLLYMFNVDKCKVMHVAHTGQHEYVLDGAKLQVVQQERDLGVEVSSSLKQGFSTCGPRTPGGPWGAFKGSAGNPRKTGDPSHIN